MLHPFFALRPLLRAAIAVLALATGCTYAQGEAEPVPCDVSPQTVTYAGVISPIFDTYCRECHGSKVASALGGGNDFGDFQGIKRYPTANLLGSIRHEPGYSPMPKIRDKMPECDIRRIEAWIAAGQPNN